MLSSVTLQSRQFDAFVQPLKEMLEEVADNIPSDIPTWVNDLILGLPAQLKSYLTSLQLIVPNDFGTGVSPASTITITQAQYSLISTVLNSLVSTLLAGHVFMQAIFGGVLTGLEPKLHDALVANGVLVG